MKNNKMKLAVLFLATLYCPSLAFASGGIDEFTSPMKSLVDIFTGELALYVSATMFVAIGIYLMYKQEDLSSGVKLALGITCGMMFIVGAVSLSQVVFGGLVGAIVC